MMIDQSLLVFVTVAEKKSFTRAAEALHMTQPAVSQYIQTLEKNVGAKLLDRNNNLDPVVRHGAGLWAAGRVAAGAMQTV